MVARSHTEKIGGFLLTVANCAHFIFVVLFSCITADLTTICSAVVIICANGKWVLSHLEFIDSICVQKFFYRGRLIKPCQNINFILAPLQDIDEQLDPLWPRILNFLFCSL